MMKPCPRKRLRQQRWRVRQAVMVMMVTIPNCSYITSWWIILLYIIYIYIYIYDCVNIMYIIYIYILSIWICTRMRIIYDILNYLSIQYTICRTVFFSQGRTLLNPRTRVLELALVALSVFLSCRSFWNVGGHACVRVCKSGNSHDCTTTRSCHDSDDHF